MALIASGSWRDVCLSGASWAITAADQFETPDAPSQPAGDSIGTMLDRALGLGQAELARRHEARKEALLRVEAQNRPDDWRQWLDQRSAGLSVA
jgi:hypothetical protein